MPLNPNECWNWQGHFRGKYPVLYTSRTRNNETAHRVSYEIFNCEKPGDKFVLHKCDNPKCVNPAHLFLGDHKANMQDMVSKGRHKELKKTHCPQGHAYAGENLIIMPTGFRRCRKCHNSSEVRRRRLTT